MKVVIVGGTHGNEKTGVYLIQRWQKSPHLLPAGHEYLLLQGNPKAIELNQRYIDCDLNRSFGSGAKDAIGYEKNRSLEIQRQIDIWAAGEPFFFIDLHTTTSNMGSTLVLTHQDAFTARVVQKLVASHPMLKVIFDAHIGQENHYINSVANQGFTVEMGPVAQNSFDANVIHATEQIVMAALLSIQAVNETISSSQYRNRPAPELKGYFEAKTLKYPNGHPRSIIHPKLLGQDFVALENGAPLFLTEAGDEITFQDEEIYYPIFINEVAYYNKDIAMILTKLQVRKFDE